MKFGYFPGCSLLGSSREYDESLRAITEALGVELVEVPDWNCCGASAAHSLNHDLALALPARILALAEQAGLAELLVPCSACYNRLASTRLELAENAELRKRVNGIIEMQAKYGTKIVSVLDVLGRCAADGLKAKVRRPFGRKVACYYGCYLTRPEKIAACKRTEDPQEMDELMSAVGAQPVDWAFKVECCGAGFSVSQVNLVAELSGKIVEDAVHRGAEAIVVACPMCHTNLDLRRDAILQHCGERYSIPVMYVSQVIGLALGLEERTLGLHRHHVPVQFATAAPAVAASSTKPEPAPQAAAKED